MFGAAVERDPKTHSARVNGSTALAAAEVKVPGDPSSAAFWAVAAALVPESEVRLECVSLNPTRIGALAVLERMGADVALLPTSTGETEPFGDIVVRHAEGLRGVDVAPSEVATLIDEVPVLSVAACRCEGVTRFEGVGELRVKESDRLAAIAQALTELGADVAEGADSLTITGPRELGGAELDSLGDHRLAMAWTVAALAASEPVGVERFEAVDVSYPRFLDDLRALGGPA
jgi:3-phosphoshikimate 1-carboxyvinyltransferase